MASQEITAVFNAVENISQKLNDVGRSIESLKTDFKGLDMAMSQNSAISKAHEDVVEELGDELSKTGRKASKAQRELMMLTGQQNINVASAATLKGSMELAAEAIEDAGDEALTTAGKMGVLDTVMKELSLSGSALSVNIGAFNVSLRNLAPLVPIVASMGSMVTVAGALATAVGEAAVAFGALGLGGAIAFADKMQAKFAGITNRAEALEAILGGIRDMFIEALQPLINSDTREFFVDTITGLAELTNRFAQAVAQMQDMFFDFFGEIANIVSDEFDNIATAIQNTFAVMDGILIDFFEWFMTRLPSALRFMANVTKELAGPLSELGTSLIDVFTSIIETAVSVFQGLAPALGMVLSTVAGIIDAIEVLGNGFLQAAVLIGGLTLAGLKFLSIADSIARVGLTAAKRWMQFGSATSGSMSTAASAIDGFAKKSFRHLRSLGMLLSGNRDLTEATTKKQEDLAKTYREVAQKASSAKFQHKLLTEQLEDLKQEMVEVAATAESAEVGEKVGDAAQEGVEEVNDAADNLSNNVGESVRNGSDEAAEAAAEMSDEVAGAADDASESLVDKFSGTKIKRSDITPDKPLLADYEVGSTKVEQFKNKLDEGIDLGPGLQREFDVGTIEAPEVEPIEQAPLPVPYKSNEFDDVNEKMAIASSNAEALGESIDDVQAPSNIEIIKGKFRSLGDTLRGVGGTAGSVFGTVVGKLDDFSTSVRNSFKSIGQSAVTGMSVMAGAAVESVGIMVDRARSAGGATQALSNKLAGAKKRAFAFAGALTTAASSALGTAASLAVLTINAIKSEIALIAGAFAGWNFAAGLTAIKNRALTAAASLYATVSGAIASAASFVTATIAAYGLGTALNIAFAGIPAILGAIVAAAALVVGVLGNLDAITSGAKSTFEGFKNAIVEIGDALMKAAIPLWNLFIDLVEALLAPFVAIWDGLKRIAGAFGLMGDEGESAGGIISMLIGLFDWMMSSLGAGLKALQPVISFIGDLLYYAFFVPLNLIAGAIELAIAAFSKLVGFLINSIPGASLVVDGLVSLFQSLVGILQRLPQLISKAMETVSSVIDSILTGITKMMQPFIDELNNIIEASNNILGTNFKKIGGGPGGRDVSNILGGARVDEKDVKQNIQSDKEEQNKDDVSTEPNVNLNLEDNVQNNIEVDADSEKKEQLKRIVKDAMNEANSITRRTQGTGQ